jgi:hypothetical protein
MAAAAFVADSWHFWAAALFLPFPRREFTPSLHVGAKTPPQTAGPATGHHGGILIYGQVLIFPRFICPCEKKKKVEIFSFEHQLPSLQEENCN